MPTRPRGGGAGPQAAGLALYVIRVVRQEGPVIGPFDAPPPEGACWVVEYDPDQAGGRGVALWTDRKDFARRFASVEEAITYYARQSRVLPYRPDGVPNRPLSAFTVEIEPI